MLVCGRSLLKHYNTLTQTLKVKVSQVDVCGDVKAFIDVNATGVPTPKSVTDNERALGNFLRESCLMR